MSMFMRILVPLDGTALAEKALPYAATLAHRLNSELMLAKVVEGRPYGALTHAEIEAEQHRIAEATSYLQTIYDLLTNWQTPLRLPAEQVYTKVSRGDPLTELVKLTEDERVDLIVMTTHSRTGMARLMEGSVAIGLVEQTELPVLLVHPTPGEELEPLTELINRSESVAARFVKNPFLRLVVALDGSHEAEAALRPATRLAEDLEAPIYLLRVEEGYHPPRGFILDADLGPDTDSREALPADIYRYLSPIQDAILDQEIHCVDVVRSGNPATEIASYGAQLTAPVIIVMATHASERTSAERKYSVAEEVVRRSHLPVLLLNIPRPATVTA